VVLLKKGGYFIELGGGFRLELDWIGLNWEGAFYQFWIGTCIFLVCCKFKDGTYYLENVQIWMCTHDLHVWYVLRHIWTPFVDLLCLRSALKSKSKSKNKSTSFCLVT